MSKSKFLLPLLVVAFFSCGKESNKPNPAPVNNLTGKLAKVDLGVGIYDSLFYGQDGKLNKISTYYESGGTVTYKENYFFSYNNNGKPASVQIENADEYRYTYINGIVAAVSRYENGVKTNYKIYNYTADNLLESVELYEKPLQGGVGFAYTERTDYTYYPGGNLKTETQYQIDPLGQAIKLVTTIYEDYDQRTNVDAAFRNFLYMTGISTMKNNARKVTRRNETTGAEQVYYYQFDYVSNNSPSKRIMRRTPGGAPETEIVYSYY